MHVCENSVRKAKKIFTLIIVEPKYMFGGGVHREDRAERWGGTAVMSEHGGTGFVDELETGVTCRVGQCLTWRGYGGAVPLNHHKV